MVDQHPRRVPRRRRRSGRTAGGRRSVRATLSGSDQARSRASSALGAGTRGYIGSVADRATFRLKAGLAEMLKGGVIMDVTTAEQAKIAEVAGACAVMALERVPADIRAQGGV